MDIFVSNITKSYGNRQILNNISFGASSGECICITGRNGCGKTTLLSILSLVEKPDSGTLSYRDNRVKIGYLPQVNPLLDKISVKDNLLLWCDNRDYFDYVTGRFELADILKKPVRQLSGGMKRRLALACSMANNPDILIMDEPTAAIDIVYKGMIHDEMKTFLANQGIIIMVSHEEDEIALCTRRYYMNNGGITL